MYDDDAKSTYVCDCRWFLPDGTLTNDEAYGCQTLADLPKELVFESQTFAFRWTINDMALYVAGSNELHVFKYND